jgi:hypothetical protein
MRGNAKAVWQSPPRLRTIQDCPKDLPTLLRQAVRAANRLRRGRRFLVVMTGSVGATQWGRKPHVRHEATRVHHPAGRCGGDVALVRAQQPQRMRRIGVPMLYEESDPVGQGRATAFRQSLESSGGRSVAILKSISTGGWVTLIGYVPPQCNC